MTMRSILAMGAAAVALTGCSTMGMPSRDQLVAEPSACTAKRFDIYFAEDQAALTDAARTAIGVAATQLQGCQIKTVRVLGLASSTGDEAANQALSEQRALTVAEALTSHGWPAPAFELAAAGDQGATTPSGVSEPLRRRTEVLVDAAPR